MNTLFNKRFQFYLWVGLAWLSIWIFNASLSSSRIFFPQSINELWRVIFLIIANFVFFEYGLPFIVKKRTTVFFNILIGSFLVAIQFIILSFGLYAWKYLGTQLHVFTTLRHVKIIPDTAFSIVIEDVMYQAQGGFTSLFFFGISKLFYDNFKLKQTAQKLRLEKQEAELNYLKSQTNPHFLFNTLNNIYSLSRDKSDLAPESILRLSKILRFMLYETNGEFITVEQELEIISDYIALEKMRYDDSLRLNFNQNIDDLKQPLPPLLLIPLVENAFKHGVSETSDKPVIDIDLSVNKKQLIFCIKNSTESSNDDKTLKENIGLSNLRRQLELLYKDFSLIVEKKEAEFTATLKINLASHG
ncbi:MAG: sensor histidine kinase [Bacteroidetes bacterium]|nr:sensor histidine kinase [Bacteroidota bacterium]